MPSVYRREDVVLVYDSKEFDTGEVSPLREAINPPLSMQGCFGISEKQARYQPLPQEGRGQALQDVCHLQRPPIISCT